MLVQIAGALVILLRGATSTKRMLTPRWLRKEPPDRLVSLTYRDDVPSLGLIRSSSGKPQFWKDLVATADSAPAENISEAKPVRRLVRLSDGETVELKLSHPGGNAPGESGREETTAYFRFEDAAGPIGFAAIEQHGSDALLHSVYLLSHRRGAGVGSELVSQVMDAAAALDVERIWLLTAAAAPFFAKLGFRRVERDAFPKGIAGRSAVRSAPPSAIGMAIDLELPFA